MEINGFEIEQYNQHGFKEGATSSTCPNCSEDRKPENKKKDKSASKKKEQKDSKNT